MEHFWCVKQSEHCPTDFLGDKMCHNCALKGCDNCANKNTSLCDKCELLTIVEEKEVKTND